MARTPTQPIEIIDAPTSAPATELAIITGQDAAHAAQNAARIVAQQVGYELDAGHPDADLIQRDIAANMRRSVEACLEVGRGLAVLKALCPHGEFGARLEVLGLDKFVASRFMQAAAKFSKLPSTATLAIGSQTKLFEMLVLDDEQIEELAEDGMTGSLKLDDVVTMSVKELRLAVRRLRGQVGDERAEQDALRERLGKRAEELELVRAKLERKGSEPVKPDEALLELRAEADRAAHMVMVNLDAALRSAFSQLADHHEAHGGDSRRLMAAHLANVMTAAREIADAFGVDHLAGDGRPEWERWNDEQDALAAKATAAATATEAA